MSKWGNIVNKVKTQASVAGAQAQTAFQVSCSLAVTQLSAGAVT